MDVSKQQCATELDQTLDADLFRALGDSTRLLLVRRLALNANPMSVSEISTCCGTHISGVSRHLAILERAGVVKSRKEGRRVLYTLMVDRLARALGSFTSALERCCETCC